MLRKIKKSSNEDIWGSNKKMSKPNNLHELYD